MPSDPALASQRGNVLAAVRAFGVLALWLVLVLRPSWTGVTCVGALTALAGFVSVPAAQRRLRSAVLHGLELTVAALVVAVGVVVLPEMMLYLLVPAFAVGVALGLAGALAALVLDLAVVAAVLWRAQEVEPVSLTAWLLAATGAAGLGAWVHQIDEQRPRTDDAYDSARRLLEQLRTVARRLSAGLDPVGIGQQLLAEASANLPVTCSAVLVGTEGGGLMPLTFQGSDRLTALTAEDSPIREVWANESASQRWVEQAGERRLIVALPLTIGSRRLGVVVAECSSTPAAFGMAGLQKSLGRHALRLDSALVFDEIRTLATADERHRMAREIHDGIAQDVASLGYTVDDLVATAAGAQRDGLRALRGELTRVVNELRLSIFDLRSEVSATGISAALSDYVRQVSARSGMTVHLPLEETPQRLHGEVETEMLRIAQEAVTNARRHSGARNLWVTIAVDPPNCTLTVTDDGHGIGATRPDSYGIKIMRERAERIGADLTIASRPEGGTIVDLTLRPDRHPHRPAERRVPTVSGGIDPSPVLHAAGVADEVAPEVPHSPRRAGRAAAVPSARSSR